MEDVSVIGIDLAKLVFQVHGIDAQGQVVLRQRLSRAKLLPFFAGLPRWLVGMETCASANYWARELIALGHEVRLMPPQYVKPYVKRSKNDASDAEAICEAVTRPTLRFVGVKSPEQQSVLVLHRTRLILTRQRTQPSRRVRDRYIYRSARTRPADGRDRRRERWPAERHGTRRPWLMKLLSRRYPRVAAIALANKIGRIAWAPMTSGERYREPAAA